MRSRPGALSFSLRSRWWLAAAAAAITACRATRPTLIPSPAPAAAACPAPALGDIKWVLVDDSTGFTLALPPGFEEHPSGASFRHWQLANDFQQSMSFGIIRGDLGLEGYRRVYQASLMLEYSECSDAVGDYTISIQSWRTPNGTFRNYLRLDRYDVFAIWEVRPGVYAYITGGTYSRPTQDLMLGALRSWRFRPT
jgi:hypothetical protein